MSISWWVRYLGNSDLPVVRELFGPSVVILRYDERKVAEVIESVYRSVVLCRQKLPEVAPDLRLYSLASYLCQRQNERALDGRFRLLLRDAASGVALIFLIAVLIAKALTRIRKPAKKSCEIVCRRINRALYQENAKAIFGTEGVLFMEEQRFTFGWRELAFLVRTFLCFPQYLLYPKLLQNTLRWLALYAHILRTYSAKTIVTATDPVVSMSLITQYLREQNVRHVNVMHGDRFLSCDGCFVEFDEFHVWGRHYADLYRRQHCPERQFIVSGCPLHTRYFRETRLQNQPRPKAVTIVFEATMSPGNPGYTSLTDFMNSLDETWTVYLRPHPQFRMFWKRFFETLLRDIKKARKYLRVVVRGAERVSQEQAILESRIMVGCSSTLLLEGWLGGSKVVYLDLGCGPSQMLYRFSGSPNVLHMALVPPTQVEEFIESPFSMTPEEYSRVDYLSKLPCDRMSVTLS